MMNNPFSPISLRRVPVRDDFGRIFGCRTSIIDIGSVKEAEGMAS
jgi:hypothetical protein